MNGSMIKFYESAGDLIVDLKMAQSMSRGKTAMVKGESLTDKEILGRMIKLAPDTFKYKAELTKSALGNQKNLVKFCEAVMKNLSESSSEEYRKDVESLSLEIEELKTFGVAESVVNQLFAAKNEANDHKTISRVINGYGEKLNSIMNKVIARLERITEANEVMVKSLRKNAKTLNLNLEAQELIKSGHEIIKANEVSVKALVPLMTQYCALNAALVSIYMTGGTASNTSTPVDDEVDSSEEDYGYNEEDEDHDNDLEG